MVAGVGFFVEADDGGVGASGRTPSLGPVVVVGIGCCSGSSGIAVGDDWKDPCVGADVGVRVERLSVDGLAVDVWEGDDVAGPRVVTGVVSTLEGASVVGAGVGSNVVVGVGSNGVVADVGDGVGLTSDEGSKVVAGVGSFVEAGGEGVGASGRTPSIGPVAGVGVGCCSGSSGAAVGIDDYAPFVGDAVYTLGSSASPNECIPKQAEQQFVQS